MTGQAIGLGRRIETAIQLRMHGAQEGTHLFDWLHTPAAGLLRMIEADFDVFHPEGLVLRTDITPHRVEDLPTGIVFRRQFPVFRGNVSPDFLRHYPDFIRRFRDGVARFRACLAAGSVTLVRQDMTEPEALALEAALSARFPGATLDYLYLNEQGPNFVTPLGRARTLRPGGSIGDPGAWAKILIEEKLTALPYRLSVSEILGDDANEALAPAAHRMTEAQVRDAIAANPGSAAFRLDLARLFLAREEWDKAEAAALAAPTPSPHDLEREFILALAGFYYGSLSADAALDRLLPLLQDNAAKPAWFALVALVLHRAGRSEQAVTINRGAIAACPDRARYYFNQAKYQRALKNFAGVALTLRAAERIEPLPERQKKLLTEAETMMVAPPVIVLSALSPEPMMYWTHPEIPFPPSSSAWQALYPNFRVFGDADVMPLLPADFRLIYEKIRLPAARSDVARLFLLRQFGGLYVDAHVGPTDPADLTRTVRPLMDHRLILFGQGWQMVAPTDFDLMNGVLAARAGAPELDILIDRILANIRQQWERERQTADHSPYDLFGLTGTYLLVHSFFDQVDPRPVIKERFRDSVFVHFMADNASSGFQLSAYKAYHVPGSHWSERQKTERFFID